MSEVVEAVEVKAVELKFEGTVVRVNVDPNKNGRPVIKLELDLMEVPSEVLDLVKSKKA